MLLYILRHGIAVLRGTAGYIDDERPLAEEGKDKMVKAAKGISKIVPGIDLILTSPLPRALDTARIVARTFKIENRIEVNKDVAPGGSMKNLLATLSKHRTLSSVMIVGHEPDLGFLASGLLGFDGSIIEFKKGALCCIELATVSRGRGKLLWHLQPKHMRELA
jgi:phosphohistidine phosphatase